MQGILCGSVPRLFFRRPGRLAQAAAGEIRSFERSRRAHARAQGTTASAKLADAYSSGDGMSDIDG
jgi:hypothetical protein